MGTRRWGAAGDLSNQPLQLFSLSPSLRRGVFSRAVKVAFSSVKKSAAHHGRCPTPWSRQRVPADPGRPERSHRAGPPGVSVLSAAPTDRHPPQGLHVARPAVHRCQLPAILRSLVAAVVDGTVRCSCRNSTPRGLLPYSKVRRVCSCTVVL